MFSKTFRTKKMEIGHLIRKFKGCKPECEKELEELKTKFDEWNSNNKGTNVIKLIELKGIGLNNLKDAFSLNLKALKEAGFSLEELKDAGFSVKELFVHPSYQSADSKFFTAKELYDAGYSAKELYDALKNLTEEGFTKQQLEKVRYTLRNFEFEILNEVKPQWKKMWIEVFEKHNVLEKVERKYSKYQVYPLKHNLLETFKYFDLHETKLVFLGQDPYINSFEINGLDIPPPTPTEDLYQY
tara:strand:- start:39 stop:764 length:726 start_codon:yes stop_codon:yes gene_type:complete